MIVYKQSRVEMCFIVCYWNCFDHVLIGFCNAHQIGSDLVCLKIYFRVMMFCKIARVPLIELATFASTEVLEISLGRFRIESPLTYVYTTCAFVAPARPHSSNIILFAY